MPSLVSYNIFAACVALIFSGEESNAFNFYRPPSIVLSSLPLHATNRNATDTDEKAVAMVSRNSYILHLSNALSPLGKTHHSQRSIHHQTMNCLIDFIGKTKEKAT
jgi:hypothetical protein